MHRSVLQNKKYIKFAEENTVEVICIGGAQQAVASGHAKAGTYKAKDGNVYLIEFPGMTAEQLDELARSGAAKYRGKGIPYTAVVNPHTLEEMTSMLGGQSSKSVMGAVLEQKKALNAQYGKSLKRKDLRKFDKQEADVRGLLETGKLDKALGGAKKLEQGVAKKPEALRNKAKALTDDVLKACGEKLDELEAVIARGALKEASKELGPLARALKGTALEERAKELLAKAKQ